MFLVPFERVKNVTKDAARSCERRNEFGTCRRLPFLLSRLGVLALLLLLLLVNHCASLLRLLRLLRLFHGLLRAVRGVIRLGRRKSLWEYRILGFFVVHGETSLIIVLKNEFRHFFLTPDWFGLGFGRFWDCDSRVEVEVVTNRIRFILNSAPMFGRERSPSPTRVSAREYVNPYKPPSEMPIYDKPEDDVPFGNITLDFMFSSGKAVPLSMLWYTGNSTITHPALELEYTIPTVPSRPPGGDGSESDDSGSGSSGSSGNAGMGERRCKLRSQCLYVRRQRHRQRRLKQGVCVIKKKNTPCPECGRGPGMFESLSPTSSTKKAPTTNSEKIKALVQQWKRVRSEYEKRLETRQACIRAHLRARATDDVITTMEDVRPLQKKRARLN